MKQLFFACMAGMLLLNGCSKSSETIKDLLLKQKPGKFSSSTNITNPYFPAPIGKKYIYEGETPDGQERVEEKRLNSTKLVNGVRCIVVNFKAYVDDELVEEAWDWYAQDDEGTVWYFGEAVDNYEDGRLDNHDGSWEAGVDGAEAGIIMPAEPRLGMWYREEYYPGFAEDEAAIVGLGTTVTVPFGTYKDCIKTKNWTSLEPGQVEYKFYAPGTGLVKETNPNEESEIVLVKIK